jgi:hypothetical protein
VLLGATLAGTEFISSFLVPSSPARDLRPISVQALRSNIATVLAELPDLIPVYNDWSLRDRPRTIERPDDIRFRSVLVGDSFLEGAFVHAPVPAHVERRWSESGRTDMEAINFGVSATGPRQYYYRIRDVALGLRPDVIVVVVYVGNDFVSTPLRTLSVPPLIDELPLPSLLGTVAPRTTWLTVDRLGLSEIARGGSTVPGEFTLLNEWAHKPPVERLDFFVRHMKGYFPKVSEDTIREILSRGGDRLWTAFAKRPTDREFVASWLLSGMIDWETGTWNMPRDPEEADRMDGASMVEETLSWLAGAERLARESGVQLVVALAPVGTVDPNYVEFWRPWPKYFSASLSADARHRRLAAMLRERGQPFIDLRDDLGGVAGAYRLTDGHWTELGTEIVADRLSRELLRMRKQRYAP